MKTTRRSRLAAGAILAIGHLVHAGCSAGASHDANGNADASLVDTSGEGDDTSAAFDVPSSEISVDGGGDGGGASCVPLSIDMTGCVCTTEGATRPCFSGDPSNRGIGACKDGTQTCSGGEIKTWGKCTGDTLPAKEVCTDTLDHDCNHLVGCKDPSCAADAACKTGCKDGDVRDCYTGPAGTLGVGTCKAGKQKCTGGAWETTCTGEVDPTAEICSDPLDHNCNHAPGCLDLFSCIADPACGEKCKAPLDSGCVCPDGSGDTATCPKGMHGVSGGTIGAPTIECCPCKASDCGDANCCGESVCAGNSKCGSVTCKPLPPSCGGKVNTDCDDFPEDCDEPCCECYGDCSSTP